MKKFAIVLLALFTVNLACKKEDIGGGRLCACDTISYVGLNLSIRSGLNQDLLNPALANSFSESQIQLYKKSANGDKIVVRFTVRPPFNYGNSKFDYFQIFSDEIVRITTSVNDTYYLKLADQEPYVLNLAVNGTNKKIDRLLIDAKEAQKENNLPTNYQYNIFYLVKP